MISKTQISYQIIFLMHHITKDKFTESIILPLRLSNFSKYSAANTLISFGRVRSISVDKPTKRLWKPLGIRNFVLDIGGTIFFAASFRFSTKSIRNLNLRQ